MSNTLSSGLPSGARSLRREPPPIQRRYRSKRVRLGSPACIQQEGFCAPCGGVEAKTHNIAAVGGNGARCIKTRPATQQAGISGVQVFHSTGGRPAKGAECPSGVASLSDHHRAVGGDAISIAAIAAQRAQPSQRRFHGGGAEAPPPPQPDNIPTTDMPHNTAITPTTVGTAFGVLKALCLPCITNASFESEFWKRPAVRPLHREGQMVASAMATAPP